QFLNIELSEKDLVWSKNLDPATRKTNLFDLLSGLLIQISKSTPLFIVLYDLHWGNSSTLEFLNYIAKNIKDERILLMTSYRPFSSSLPESLIELKKLDYYSDFILNELTTEQSIKYIKMRWNISYIPENIVNLLKNSVGGNPYYIETMMTSLINKEQLLYDEEKEGYYFSKDVSKEIEVPETIQGLIVSEIDRLDETAKLLLKASSVIGSNFTANLLKNIFPIDLDLNKFNDILINLSDKGFLEKEEKENGEVIFSFRNELTQESAYLNLPFVQRKNLHETTASVIERFYNTKLESYYDILAYHYSYTDNINKQLLYFKLAGEKAKNNYANKESIKYFMKVSELLETKIKKTDATIDIWSELDCELFDVYITLSDISRFMGEMNTSKDWLTKAESAVVKVHDEQRRFTLLRSFGEWFEFGDLYTQALEYYSRAYKCISELNDIQKKSLSSGHIGNLYRTIGENDLALERYKEAAQLANECGDIMMEGRWLGNIGIVYMNKGDYEPALKYYFKALSISRTEYDKSREAAWLSLIASIYVAQSKYEEALKYGYDSIEVAKAIGYKRSIVLTLNTIGNTYRFLGNYNKALETHLEALDIASKIGAINQEVICMGEIGEIYRFQENFEEALLSYQEAYSRAKSLGDKYNQALWERAMGIVYYQSPNSKVKKAKQHLRSSMEMADSIGDKKLKAESQIHLGNAYAADGEVEEAERIIRKGLNLAIRIKHPGLTNWGKRMLGIVLLKLGKTDSGRNELLSALEENERLGLTKDVAECSFELGRELKDISYIKKALELFKEINLKSKVKKVESYLKLIKKSS
ncbi:MAG: tetratricopeptide repeat protein, partial [Spirochaetota bacterium]